MTALPPVAQSYVEDLERAAVELPARRRAALVESIREHLMEAAAEAGDDADALEQAILALGSPQALIAEASMPDQGDFGNGAHGGYGAPGARERAGPGAREWTTLALLAVGGIVVPVMGWFVGVALLWTSSVWSHRAKIIGTLVVPFGFALAFLLLVVPVSNSVSDCSTPADEPVRRFTSAPELPCGVGSGTSPVVVITLTGAVVLAEVGGLAYLVRSAAAGEGRLA